MKNFNNAALPTTVSWRGTFSHNSALYPGCHLTIIDNLAEQQETYYHQNTMVLLSLKLLTLLSVSSILTGAVDLRVRARSVHRLQTLGAESLELAALFDEKQDYRDLFSGSSSQGDTRSTLHDEEARLEAVRMLLAQQMSMSLPPTTPPLTLAPTISPSDIVSDFPSIILTELPSDEPSDLPSFAPTELVTGLPSDVPSFFPSEMATELPSDVPSQLPSPLLTEEPSDIPSTAPFISSTVLPSDVPSPVPSVQVSDIPSVTPTIVPSVEITSIPTINPTREVSEVPSDAPSLLPSVVLSEIPSTLITDIPTATSSDVPSSVLTGFPSYGLPDMPTVLPTVYAIPELPTVSPTLFYVPLADCGSSEAARSREIVSLLEAYSDSRLIHDESLPQGKATTWLIEQDALHVCPGGTTCQLLQRWLLAVLYFATGGDEWTNCSANSTVGCGAMDTFQGQNRFLSAEHECTWAGITCENECVTEIRLVDNHLVGE